MDSAFVAVGGLAVRTEYGVVAVEIDAAVGADEVVDRVLEEEPGAGVISGQHGDGRGEGHAPEAPPEHTGDPRSRSLHAVTVVDAC